MAQLPAENSTLARAVRRAAEQGRLSHAIVLSGDGDLLGAARFIAAAHVCGEEGKPCLRCRHCRKVLEGIHPDVTVVRDTEHRELTVDAVRPCGRMCTSGPTRRRGRCTSSPTAISSTSGTRTCC